MRTIFSDFMSNVIKPVGEALKGLLTYVKAHPVFSALIVVALNLVQVVTVNGGELGQYHFMWVFLTLGAMFWYKAFQAGRRGYWHSDDEFGFGVLTAVALLIAIGFAIGTYTVQPDDDWSGDVIIVDQNEQVVRLADGFEWKRPSERGVYLAFGSTTVEMSEWKTNGEGTPVLVKISFPVSLDHSRMQDAVDMPLSMQHVHQNLIDRIDREIGTAFVGNPFEMDASDSEMAALLYESRVKLADASVRVMLAEYARDYPVEIPLDQVSVTAETAPATN